MTTKATLPSGMVCPDLAIEFHYVDRDVGVYDDLDIDLRHLWANFTKSHKPSHILIRPNTEQGQQLSNNLFNAVNMIAALDSLIDAINATGGAVRAEDGTIKPVADKDWSDLGHAYVLACRALGVTPRIAS